MLLLPTLYQTALNICFLKGLNNCTKVACAVLFYELDWIGIEIYELRCPVEDDLLLKKQNARQIMGSENHTVFIKVRQYLIWRDWLELFRIRSDFPTSATTSTATTSPRGSACSTSPRKTLPVAIYSGSVLKRHVFSYFEVPVLVKSSRTCWMYVEQSQKSLKKNWPGDIVKVAGGNYTSMAASGGVVAIHIKVTTVITQWFFSIKKKNELRNQIKIDFPVDLQPQLWFPWKLSTRVSYTNDTFKTLSVIQHNSSQHTFQVQLPDSWLG